MNAEKSFFDRNKLKYQGFKITRLGIIPLPDKVEAIKNLVVPTTKKQSRNFIETYGNIDLGLKHPYLV